MHSRKFLTIIPSIIDHTTSITFKSWHKRKNSISIKAQIVIIKLKKKNQTNKYRHFKLRFESPQKHKQDSLNIKPKTHNHLSLTKLFNCLLIMANFTESNIHCPQLADQLVEATSGYTFVIYIQIDHKKDQRKRVEKKKRKKENVK